MKICPPPENGFVYACDLDTSHVRVVYFVGVFFFHLGWFFMVGCLSGQIRYLVVSNNGPQYNGLTVYTRSSRVCPAYLVRLKAFVAATHFPIQMKDVTYNSTCDYRGLAAAVAAADKGMPCDHGLSASESIIHDVGVGVGVGVWVWVGGCVGG